MRAAIHLLALGTIAAFVPPGGDCAESATSDGTDASAQVWAVHGQFTYVEQQSDSFRAPYRGTNSLTPDQGRETVDATLYLGARLWPGAEAWVSPEVDQGFGLDDTVGIAAFPSGEAYKVGRKQPYLKMPHAFVRQSIAIDGTAEIVEPDLMQMAGSRSADRWVFTLGKFAVTDIFDTNSYAHDQRNDFLNWAAIDAGSYDYAADAWGYTLGAAVEWYQAAWTIRAGWFDLSNVPNSPHLDPGGHEFQLDGEIERRYSVGDQPGRLLATMFESRGRMGLLDEAVALAQSSGTPVDIMAVRRYRSRLGISVDLQQQLAPGIGIFARAGKAAGNVEPYEFTDIDRTMAAGVSVQGWAWRRARDTLGIVAIADGISAARERYLNAGGLGVLIGDGKLPHSAGERVAEAYYRLSVFAQAEVSLDYQWIKNPAYNTDRGPVSIIGLRVHAQF